MHIVHRILDISKKKKSSLAVTEKTIKTYNTEESSIMYEHVIEKDENDNATVVTVSDTLVIESKAEELDDTKDVFDSDWEKEVIESQDSNMQAGKEDSSEALVIESIEKIQDVAQVENIVDNNTEKPSVTPTTVSIHAFGHDTPMVIETPKDIDAARNIAQWHSRDDIVRDKFEKHIQKIRYEAWILKQRNDMLWYEKKLVEWITLLPNDKDFQKQLSDLYFHQWKYKKAQSLLKKILTENPEDHNALWQVGEIATEEWHTEDAYVYFKQAYALCDDNPKYCFSLAQWYYDNDDLENALPLMEKMVKLRPKNIDYLVSLSHVQHKIWLRDEAKQSMLRALELDPMNLTLKNYLKAL